MVRELIFRLGGNVCFEKRETVDALAKVVGVSRDSGRKELTEPSRSISKIEARRSSCIRNQTFEVEDIYGHDVHQKKSPKEGDLKSMNLSFS